MPKEIWRIEVQFEEGYDLKERFVHLNEAELDDVRAQLESLYQSGRIFYFEMEPVEKLAIGIRKFRSDMGLV